MLSRQSELVHRRYTADQETVASCRSTRFAGKSPRRSTFTPKPTYQGPSVRGKLLRGKG